MKQAQAAEGGVMRLWPKALVHLILGLAAATCGSEEPNVPDGGSGRFLPMGVGAEWTYRVTEGGTGMTTEKRTRVEALEAMDGPKTGAMAYRVRTEKLDGFSLSWQEDTGTAIVRHRELEMLNGGSSSEEWYEPHRLRLDETAPHLQAGATWTEQYIETRTSADGVTRTSTRSELWQVEAVDEPVTVPAGTFRCLRVRRVRKATTEKTYWFARSVGKVKEVGGQTEELVRFTPPAGLEARVTGR